mgnify:CR=1 FL=1
MNIKEAINKLLLVNFVTVMIFFLSCSKKRTYDNTNPEMSRTDSIPSVKYESSSSEGIPQNFDISLLHGAWWLNISDPHALFFIENDSLYYVEEQDSPYFVNVKNDILMLMNKEIKSQFKLRKLTVDSLVFYDPTIDEELHLFKKKE